jgi:hypothetical protein
MMSNFEQLQERVKDSDNRIVHVEAYTSFRFYGIKPFA